MKKFIHYCDCCKTELTKNTRASKIIIDVDKDLSFECKCLDLCDKCKTKIKTGVKKIQVTECWAWDDKIKHK